MEVLKLENLSKYYTSKSGVVMGLSSVNLSFSIGEFVAITGESGSGKSTLAHVLGGIIPYESGELYVNGEPTSHYDASDWEHYRRDYISFISQSYGILVGNTVLENVESALRFGGIEKEEANKRALEILEEVELSEFKNRKAGKLSSGQKQRLSIARALAKPSRILIADEPTGNLDKENSDKVIALLHRASKDRLVVLITHEFSEVEKYATRRVIISDASIVTDAPLRASYASPVQEEKEDSADKKKPSKRPLFPYVSYLTIKSRPVFTTIISFLLAVTMAITFVFLGTFIVALDDTPTRIYDNSAFMNPNSKRIVAMRLDGRPFTDADYEKIMGISYVEGYDCSAYVSDVNYYYRPDVDFREYTEMLAGPNYHPVFNPDDLFLTNAVEFLSNDLFLKTIRASNELKVSEGEMPDSIYEVLSADPSHEVGDKVTVIIKDRQHWALSSYIKLSMTVSGKTSHGEGLYVTEQLVSVVNRAVDYSATLYMPYEEGVFDIENVPENFDGLSKGEIMLPENVYSYEECYGKYFFFRPHNTLDNPDAERFVCEGTFDCTYPRLILFNSQDYERLVLDAQYMSKNPISVYIKDYSYTDRVLKDLGAFGYMAASPFRIGATTVDSELAVERIVTLVVCFAVFALCFILQLILVRALFNSTHEHYRLMANIGLTSRIAYRSIALAMLVFTLIGEAVGFGTVLIMNASGLSFVVDIFKYLDSAEIFLLILSHFAACALSLGSVIKSVKSSVFATESKEEDMDFDLIEEVSADD